MDILSIGDLIGNDFWEGMRGYPLPNNLLPPFEKMVNVVGPYQPSDLILSNDR